MNATRLDPSVLAEALRTTIRGWDQRSEEALEHHGADALLRQEIHRLTRVASLLDGVPPPTRVLEIGLGYLSTAVMLRRLFPHACIVGMEHPARTYVRTAAYRAKLETERIASIGADFVRSGIPLRARSFDVVVCAEVFEHLSPDATPDFLRDVRRVMVTGGVLVLTTPNLAAWENRELLLRGHSPQQTPACVIDGTCGHLRLYTMEELTALLTGAGFRIDTGRYADQVSIGRSGLRLALRAAMWPMRRLCPALQDTCLIRAVRVEAGAG